MEKIFITKNNLDKVISAHDSFSNINFCIGDETVIRLEKNKFIYRGQEILDVNQVYEKFCEWMKNVNLTPKG